MRGFTFVEIILYSGLFSILLLGLTSTWFSLARSSSTFEELAKIQEASLFAATLIANTLETTSTFSAAQAILTSQKWHSISQPVITLESASSLSHIAISFSVLSASSTWQLDSYVAQ